MSKNIYLNKNLLLPTSKYLGSGTCINKKTKIQRGIVFVTVIFGNLRNTCATYLPFIWHICVCVLTYVAETLTIRISISKIQIPNGTASVGLCDTGCKKLQWNWTRYVTRMKGNSTHRFLEWRRGTGEVQE